MTQPSLVLVADYVDHSARSWADALIRARFIVHRCRPVDVGPALQAYRARVLILAVSRLRGPISFSDLEGRLLPVIVVSADPSDVGRASQFGGELILPRPTRAATVVEAVHTVLGVRRNEPTSPSRHRPDATVTEKSAGSILRARSKQLCGQSLDLRWRAAELVACAERLVG